ncbi:MAG: hypothetical protein ACP5MG_08165 [Verrucomicrobiia bacterium]|jgi:cell division protein FtsB
MTKRNKKLHNDALKKPAAVILVFLIALLGLGFVREKHSAQNLGQEISSLEQRLEKLRRENALLREQIAALKSPQALLLRAQELRLGLVLKQANQTVPLVEPTNNLASFASGFEDFDAINNQSRVNGLMAGR